MIMTILFLFVKTFMFFKTHSISVNHCSSKWKVMNGNVYFITEKAQLNNGETISWTDNFISLIPVLKIKKARYKIVTSFRSAIYLVYFML
jgi:hypothetical protein